jgi:hypothetical protein
MEYRNRGDDTKDELKRKIIMENIENALREFI